MPKLSKKDMAMVVLVIVSIAIAGLGLAFTESLSGRIANLETTMGVVNATHVRMGITPWSALAVLYQQYRDVQDIWSTIEKKYNVKFDWAWPEDDVSTFFYGGCDVIAVGPLEAAELTYNRGLNTTVFGGIEWNEDALVVRGDSNYTKVTDLKGKKLANIGWDSGAVKDAELLWYKEFGLNLTTDFQWVVAPPDVCIELLHKGEVEGALDYGYWGYGIAEYGMKLLYGPYTAEYQRLTGHLGLAVSDWVTTTNMLEKHPEVAKAINEGWQQSYNYLFAHLEAILPIYYTDAFGLTTPQQQNALRSIWPPTTHFMTPGPLTSEIVDSEFQSLTWAYQAGLLDQQPTKDIFYNSTA